MAHEHIDCVEEVCACVCVCVSGCPTCVCISWTELMLVEFANHCTKVHDMALMYVGSGIHTVKPNTLN